MENNNDFLQKLEADLKNSKQNPPPIYRTNIHASSCIAKLNEQRTTPQDVILNVSKQLKALQNADCFKKQSHKMYKVHKYKTSTLLPINMLPDESVQTGQNELIDTHKNELQSVSDTQLIKVVENIEAAINTPKGVTQEFEISFCEKHLIFDKGDRNLDSGPNNKETDSIDTNYKFPDCLPVNSINGNIINNNKKESVNNSNSVDKTLPIELNEYNNNYIKDTRSLSPIIKPRNQGSNTFPLIYSLEAFEKFEAIAVPLVEENVDFEAAKKVINSQILEKELVLANDINSIVSNVRSGSPILNVRQEKSLLESIVFQQKEDSSLNHSVTREKNIEKHLEDFTKCPDDEILFSSDEENCLNESDCRELPLTCALETSFYNQSNVLDKTVYVGFQTASNKSMQVHTESLHKAQNLLEKINNSQTSIPSLTELINMYDNDHLNKNDKTSKSLENLVEEKSSEKCHLKPEDYILDIKDGLKCFNEENCEEFQVADKISEVAMSVSEQESKEKRKSGKQFKGDCYADSFETLKVHINKAEKQNVFGFKTANNKRIKVSEKALARCNKVFQDIDITENYENVQSNNTLKCNKSSTLLKCMNQDIAKTSKENCIENIMTKNLKQVALHNPQHINIEDQTIIHEFENISMFPVNTKNDSKNTGDHCLEKKPKTQHNETIGTYDIKELKQQHIYEKFNKDDKNVSAEIVDCVAFKTASNKKIEISKDALFKTKNIFQDLDLEDNNNIDCESKEHQFNAEKNNACFIGFKTANNKVIKISDEALHKTKSIFQNIEQDNFEMLQTKHDSKTVIDNSSSCLKQNNNSQCDESICKYINNALLEQPMNEKLNGYNKNISMQIDKCVGFKTASNKKIEIPEQAFFKIKNVFQDIDFSDNENSTCKIKTLQNNALKNQASFEGFKTANNKKITISNAALFKTKFIFQDIEQDAPKMLLANKKQNLLKNINTKVTELETCDETQDCQRLVPEKTYSCSGTFKTVNHKGIKISPGTLLKNSKLFNQMDCKIDEPNNLNNKKQVFQGFITANNKTVAISKDALSKTKNIFRDIEHCEDLFDTETNYSKISDFAIGSKIMAQQNILDGKKDEYKTSKPTFKGFQTASNKQVQISEEALAKSKKLFNDIDLNKDEDYGFTQNDNEKTKDFTSVSDPVNHKAENIIGFKTANNTNIKISKEALMKSKKILLDVEQNVRGINGDDEAAAVVQNIPNDIQKTNLDDVLDTQMLNNFENTLYTEDFLKETPPKNCKRSGSPILSCPRAKRRKKFKAPYKDETIINNKNDQDICSKKRVESIYTFEANYKKSKMYNLNDLAKLNSHTDNEGEIDNLHCNLDSVLSFEFTGVRNDLTDTRWSIDNLKDCFSNSVNKKIIPDGWLENHIKLIIWKLLLYELLFKNIMRNICTVRNVLEQLKFRYDKELYNVERPALRKLLEKDDMSTKTMILRVVDIYADGVSVKSVADSNNIELLLSDGWYCVKACLDQMLTKLVRDKKIFVTTKLVIHGAELMNCEQGIAPWEDTSSVRLKIFGNSTRRARWDARLGYHGYGAILTPLSSVKLDGGKVSRLRGLVTRVYPTLYVEKFEDGSTVTRSERLEHLYQIKYESERQALLEKIYEEVEKDFSDQETQDSECDVELSRCLDSGSQISRQMKKSRDSGEFRANLTNTQCLLLRDYSTKRREKLLHNLHAKVEERLKARGLHVGRNVVPVMKIRIADIDSRGEDLTKAMMSIWRPNDAVLDIIKEGTWIDVFNVVPTAERYTEIQLSAGRNTIFSRSNCRENNKMKNFSSSLKRICYSIKDLVQNPAALSHYNEVDTVGFIFLIEPSIEQFEIAKGQPFQNVFLTDAEKNVICIIFWGGLKKYGFESILDTGQIVACINLQKRAGNTRKNIPQFRATEFTYFTKTSKLSNVRKMADELSKTMSTINKKQFCEECIILKNNYSVGKIHNNVENISPYRMNHSDFNGSKYKIFIDSPIAHKSNCVNDIYNLSGLDFESTFKQVDTQDISPEMILRKKKINEKIAKLKMYGEPPPLSPIHMINKSKNATSSFKSPLAAKVETKEVKNVLQGNVSNSATSIINSSPVINTKNSHKKRCIINPVKLIFSKDIDEEVNSTNNVDPFAEEFDVSPPLSLE